MPHFTLRHKKKKKMSQMTVRPCGGMWGYGCVRGSGGGGVSSKSPKMRSEGGTASLKRTGWFFFFLPQERKVSDWSEKTASLLLFLCVHPQPKTYHNNVSNIVKHPPPILFVILCACHMPVKTKITFDFILSGKSTFFFLQGTCFDNIFSSES